MKKTFIPRKKDLLVEEKIIRNGFSPLMAHIISSRTNDANADFQTILRSRLKDIPHPSLLLNAEKGAERIADAIVNKEAILSIGDFDCDGQTGNTVIIKSLALFGVDPTLSKAFVGHRLEEGYGVTELLCNRILSMPQKPSLIITTDCGSSDEPRIAQLKAYGIDVVVTDHHEVPREGSPASACCTINPVQPGCEYPDKSVAGCMVAWLTMCMVNIVLSKRGFIERQVLANLLDYVALGTVADAVSLLSVTNRAVIGHGLSLINKKSRPCWSVAFQELGMSDQRMTAQDIAFKIAPRINARSRMDDPYIALQYLISENQTTTREYFTVLDNDNTKRKEIEREMQILCYEQVEEFRKEFQHSAVAAHESFHAGVQGIVASRVTETYGTPTVILSPTNKEGIYSGSVRTVEGIHIREVLQSIEDKTPGTLLQFGGHKGAAGLKIKTENIENFRKLFNREIIRKIGTDPLSPILKTDGELARKGLLSLDTFMGMQMLQPFGNGFEEPIFHDRFTVQEAKFIGKDNPVHLSMQLIDSTGQRVKAIWFSAVEEAGMPLPVKMGDDVTCGYMLMANTFKNNTTLQLMVKEIL